MSTLTVGCCARCDGGKVSEQLDLSALSERVEGPHMERAAQKYLNEMKPMLLRIIQQSKKLPDVNDGSWLSKTDAFTSPFEASQVVRFLAHVAADNLQMTEKMLRDAIPPFAPYSLIRSALESSSIGLWILDAKNEQIGASRTLRIYRQNVSSDRAMWRASQGREAEHHEKFDRHLLELHNALKGIHPSCFESDVQSTAVIENVDRLHDAEIPENRRGMTGLQAWRISSAIVHANALSTMQILERRPSPDGEAPLRTSSLSHIVTAMNTALFRANSLLDLYAARNRPITQKR